MRAVVLAAFLLAVTPLARAEVILQYFNTSWREIADKMPELAEAGYGALWLPPPTKGSGGLSVGYDIWDPFDLGSRDQRSTVRTRYGTEEELLRLIQTAHRFGIRVYFDNIMNHRAFDVPGYNETTPIDTYPGMVPEDFHLRVTEDGFYRKWDNVANWNDAWQVQNRNFSDLIDIAQETPNANFGATEGSTYPKVYFVRHPNNPELYDYHPTLGRVGFYNTNITSGVIASNAAFYSEDVWLYLMRTVRWLVDHTKVDGLRLDAVKHVPSYFFGAQGTGKDESNSGYTGQAQEQFNITRGFTDSNHRDTVFDTELARDDLMMFGEHLGSPPGFQEYIDAGMRLVDSQLKGELNYRFGNPSATLAGLDTPGFSGNVAFNQYTGVQFAKSHDDDYVSREELHYGYELTRAGLPNIYTDGNYQSETLAQSGGAFPRHANTAFLGQFSDNRIPNLVYIHDHFARGYQYTLWSDGDYVAYQRVDKRENGGMSDEDGVVLLFMLNDNYASGAARSITTSQLKFGHTPFTDDAYLYNYSSYGGGFYVYASQLGSVVVPPGGYFAFSWRTPEESDLWKNIGGKPVIIRQNGQDVGWVAYTRKDGPNGDPSFNPYGVANDAPNDYAYTWYVPRVTSGTNLSFAARVDGSAFNVMMKLDGGDDINSQIGYGETNPADYGFTKYRDRRPGDPYARYTGDDVFLGYEDAQFAQRTGKEKFAAKDTTRNQYNSPGSESYQAVIGTPGVTNYAGTGSNDWNDSQSVIFAYHDPAATITASGQPAQNQFTPVPESAAGSNIVLWLKTGNKYDANKAYVYYTTDGATFPEGLAGRGVGNTKVAELTFVAADAGNSLEDWWKATLPAFTNGTVLRYKMGAYRAQDGSTNAPWYVPFPIGSAEVATKKNMLGEWTISGFNARTNVYYPNVDYGQTATGLVEGFHVLRARAFLERPDRAALYNTFVQPFYYDTMNPTGRIVFPATDGDTLGSQEYGAAVRVDPTVRSVWYNIQDSNPLNDDGATTNFNGNGLGTNGQPSWVQASFVTPSTFITSPYPDEYRFTYRNIPASGMATILVRLVEISSATNFTYSDADGHYTTLQRIVNTMGPTQELYVAYPEADGLLINDQWDYIMKIRFSKSMDSNVTNFLIRIDGSAQARSGYAIYDYDANLRELQYTLPDLYNGDSNYIHQIQVIYTSNGGVQYQAYRTVRAYSQATGPYVSIVTPPEVDSVGKPFVITLPDVASPTAGQRQYPIQVETDLSASNVWIEFANNAGTAGIVASTETAVAGLVDVTAGTNLVVGRRKTLTGSLSATISNNTVSGTGSAFSNELNVGNTILISTNSVVVTQIVSQTSLRLADPYPGNSVTNVASYLLPRFDVDFHAGDKVRFSTNTMTVASVASSTNALLTVAYPGPTASGITAYRVDPNPKATGSREVWSFLWQNITNAGVYTFFARVDTNGVTNTVEASAMRNVTVAFRESVTNNDADLDDDDDGLYDFNELTPTNHPSAYKNNSETWVNGDLHIWQIYGKTDPLSPDSDGDGLPDGLESGWRNAQSDTATNVDTDGDGFMNFISDLDPPFYNTLDNYGLVPGVNSQTEGGDRSLLKAGTMTDPNNPDTDYDGIPDGVEDRNRNGWVDGDGQPLAPNADPSLARQWPNNVIDAGETWTETSPTKNDSDGDGLSDGYGEDKNYNGRIDGDTNSNRIWNAGELWTETDPLNADTDGDGLPDGWEVQYGLDPWDDGVIGHTNMHTGAIIANLDNGANGNPDGDIVCSTSNDYVNLLEYQNNSNPKVFDSCAPIPEGSIVIGRGTNVLGVINGVTNYTDFTDWTWDDLIALDEYEGDGPNNQGGDEYLGWDGFDTSRDIVAFYARDGGAETGDFYFRVDFHDLQPLAEEGYLDIYVVIDTGNPAAGEMALPDDVDLVTSCRWEAVVAAYQSGNGAVYVDKDRTNNSTTVDVDLTAYGVERRDQNTPNGFKASYYDSDLDAVEFSIKRQALLDAGWNGNADSLNYQVFVTKDGTCNSCGAGGAAGAGDIGGRNDVRDTIYDDQVAEDYWQNQGSIQNALVYYFNRTNTFAGRAKVAMLVHGNQAIQPGNVIQNLINNGAGAGYERLLDIHEIYRQPVNLHITPMLASAMQWAKVDPQYGTPWRDGPSFNARIRALVQTNIVSLLASTFSDNILPYFTPEYISDNDRLSREFLQTIYGATIGTNTVFWPPERVLDGDTFSKIQNLGYTCTLVDQDTHLFYWLGRTASLSDGGYQINRINGEKVFVLNNSASNYRFQNNDHGLNMPLRGLFSRKARSGSQDQVVVLLSNWEDFGSSANADAYDKNIRWIANHPWVQLVSLQDVLTGQVDLGGDGSGDPWYVVDRGNAATNKLSHNFIQHAARGNYDNWYVGLTDAEQSLQTNRFNIRSGAPVPTEYGMLYYGGIVSQAWQKVEDVADTNLGKLARAALHASTFETAFHDEDNGSLERFSIGTYVSPDTTFDSLATFSKQAQAQTREARMYERVDAWAGIAASVTTPQALAQDVDLDGENEYVLYNDRVYGLFERSGGRMIAAWVRDLLSGRVFQVIGNQVGAAGSETEDEGAYNVDTNGFGAYRTSGLKDWYGTKGGGTSQYVNDLYTFTNWTNGWRMVSSDGDVTKTVTLQPKSWQFNVTYTLGGGMAGQTLYLRNGLSPNLYDLLLNGQATLGNEQHAGGVLRLANTNYHYTVEADIGYADAGHSATAVTNAVDDNPGQGITYYTLNMRNQAQTHQVELSGTGTFSFSLGFRAAPSDWDGDGIPNDYEDQYGFLDPTNASDANGDQDGDKMKNGQEYISNTDPNNSADFFHATQTAMTNANGIVVRFPTKLQREYNVFYANGGPGTQTWLSGTTNSIPGTGGTVEWVDDGTVTAPPPAQSTNRTYQVRVQLPQ